jgi:hypothetical protein
VAADPRYGKNATTGAVGRGAASPALRSAISDINLECAKFKKEGRIAYIDKTDAKFVYAKYKGSCAFCSYPLRSHRRGTDGLSFMFYQPLKYGGEISRDNLIPVCPRCRDRQTPSPRPLERIPNVNTIADLVDRLIVEVHKLAYFENQKRNEHAKETPDGDRIVEWDNKSRDCCELRSILKRDLNTAIEEFVCTMAYTPRAEARTFRAPQVVEGKNTIADIVDRMAYSNAVNVVTANAPTFGGIGTLLKPELIEQFESIRLTKQYKIIKE